MPTIQSIDEENTIEPVAPPPLSFWQASKRVTSRALPMALSYTFSLEIIFLTYLLSHLNEDDDHLAATGLISTLLNSIVIIGCSPLFSMSLIASRELGALTQDEHANETDQEAKRDHIAAINRNGLIIAMVLAIPMISCMVFSQKILTDVFRQDEEVAKLTQDFIRPYALAIPGILMRLCFEQVMFSFGHTKPAMLIALPNFLASMSLGGMLTLGSFNFPKMGETGALIGCILDSYLTAFAFALYIAHSSHFKDYHFFNLIKPIGPTKDQLKEIVRIGKSFLLTVSIETCVLLLANVFTGIISVEGQAAFSATMQFAFLSLLFHLAFGQTISQEMSRSLGAQQFLDVSTIGKAGLINTVIFIAPLLFLLSLDPELLKRILGEDDEAVLAYLKYIVPMTSAGCLLDAVRFNFLQQLRALGDTNGSALISSAGLGLGLLASAGLGFKSNLGVYGIVGGYGCGNLLAAGGLFYRWRSQIRPQTIQETQTQPIEFTQSFSANVSQHFCGFFKRFTKKAQTPSTLTPLQEGLLLA